MRRNVRPQHLNNQDNENHIDEHNIFAGPGYEEEEFVDVMQLGNRPSNGHVKLARFENTLEAKVQEGDTLQALALRFHCSVADIKRLNKIDRDNEIHARRVIRIPVTVHNVLLGKEDALPTVHTSGNNSPRRTADLEPAIERNPLEDARLMLDERLLVAAVNSSGSNSVAQTLEQIDRKILHGGSNLNDDATTELPLDVNEPLLSEMLVDRHAPNVRPIRGPSLRAIDWSGSDCDMSWICLLVFILALCVVIPLVYVIYLAEHPHHNHSS